jgi:flagellar biosynthetic protein FlhB
MMVVLSLLGITIFVLPWQSADLAESLAILIDNSGRISVGTGQAGVTRLGEVMFEFMIALGFVLAPIFGLLALGGLFGVMIQGETVFSLERITPKLNKISPQQGFKRLFSGSALIEFGKSLLKVFVAGALALWVTNKVVAGMMDSSGFLPESLPNYLLEAARRLLVAMSIFLIPLALLDIVWRRFEWRKKHMMSHKELRDEMKEAEGSPELKAKRAQVRREQSQKRVALAVPEASVVLTNPTHYAVALKYEPGTDLAPQCVAKGADHMAKRIRELAFDNEIPVVENKPLARLLYDTVDLDEVVPVEHWAVVAEIISFVLDLENNVHRQPPDGSSLRTLADE